MHAHSLLVQDKLSLLSSMLISLPQYSIILLMFMMYSHYSEALQRLVHAMNNLESCLLKKTNWRVTITSTAQISTKYCIVGKRD